ncbi:glutaredoxin family protein [Bacillus sp. FJAT-50079]|uniref:glutaredoxin family protein n=1 Tax=Bacillus sp. FJAT-50079 TaxID=2833577 RepID=UPI001BC9A7FC|nr:glutaredoxin family protein [Bacillus sp. FJAT-50079]MBS4208424.1 glutaredoxin family protein [Bacillus sp. FJAT-50079]
MIINFYTRKQCQLCKDALLLLSLIQEDIPFHINEIDIDESDELTEKYGMMIPVIEMNGEVVQAGVIDPTIIEEQLQKHHN